MRRETDTENVTRSQRRRQSTDNVTMPNETPKMSKKVREKGVPVRIRAGAGVNFAHVNGKYLGKGTFEIDQIAKGIGSKSGWGRLANGDGWVGLDFVEIIE